MSQQSKEEQSAVALTDELGKLPEYEHEITFYYSPTCPHCQKIEPQIEKYLEQHPKILLIKIDATTTSGTKELRSLRLSEVPVIIIDDQYLILGDIHFYERFDYTIKLAKNLVKPLPQLLTQKLWTV